MGKQKASPKKGTGTQVSDEDSDFEFNPDEEEQDHPSPTLPLSADDMDVDLVSRQLPLTTNNDLVLGNSSASVPAPVNAKRKRGPYKKKTITSSDYPIISNCSICGSQHTRGSCQAVHVPEVREELRLVLNDPSRPEPLLVRVRPWACACALI